MAAVDRDFLNLLISETTPTASTGSVLEDLTALLADIDTGHSGRALVGREGLAGERRGLTERRELRHRVAP